MRRSGCDRRIPVNGLGKLLCLLFQGAAAVGVVVAVRQQVAIFGVGDEQQAEQDGQRHGVGAVDFVSWAA